MIRLSAIFCSAVFFFIGAANGHEAPSTPEEKLAYIQNHLELVEAEAKWIKTYSDDKQPGVRISVKNNGSETLTEVEVIVYFLDDEGLPFAEEDYFPVSSVGDTNLLKPNYTQRMKKNVYYIKDDLGDEWSGKAKFEIVNIEFAK
jgi:hypothetical protein